VPNATSLGQAIPDNKNQMMTLSQQTFLKLTLTGIGHNDLIISEQMTLSTPVFFNLFEVTEPKMFSKKLAEPKLPSKNLCGTPL
jgi:hypothetical protein